MKPWRGLIENGVSVLGSSSHLCFFFLGGAVGSAAGCVYMEKGGH